MSERQTIKREFVRSGFRGLEYIEYGLRLEGDRYWVNFELLQVVSWNTDKSVASWHCEDDARHHDSTFEQATPILKGHIKWDGCNEANHDTRGIRLEQFYRLDNDGNIHLCDAAASVMELCTVWIWALRKAREMMVDEARDAEDREFDWWPEPPPEPKSYREEPRTPPMLEPA